MGTWGGPGNQGGRSGVVQHSEEGWGNGLLTGGWLRDNRQTHWRQRDKQLDNEAL